MGRRELQGSPARDDAHRPAGRRSTADVYGSKVDYHGTVAGLGAGTGSAFALLPAQNATGNWIKVVQRVPVRIALDPEELAAHPLRVGLSMEADVDMQRRDGARLPARTPAGNRLHDGRVRRGRRRGGEARAVDHRRQRGRPPRRSDPACASIAGTAAAHPHPSSRPPSQRRRRRALRRSTDRMPAAAHGRDATTPATASRARTRRRPPLRAAVRRDAGARHRRAVAGDVHERARHVDRQRVDAGHRRRPRREPDQGTWVITSFAVANAISVPLTGWLTQRFGQVRLFVAACCCSCIASWLCGLAPSIGLLIVFRVAAGRGRRADDPAVADAAAVELSAGARPASRWRCGR